MEMQGHKDRLSAIDASFLHQEKQASHMHVGALVIFEGPPPSHDDFSAHIRSRLPLVPRYRQRLAFPRFALISKTHHALVDGVSGVDIATVLFDLEPVPAEMEEDDDWTPAPVPSDVELVAEGVKGLV